VPTLTGVAVRGVTSTVPCLLSIIAFCFPNGMSSSSSPKPLVLPTTGASDRKSRSSDDSGRELWLTVEFGREKRFKNLDTADCAGPSVVVVDSIGLVMTSAGDWPVGEIGEVVFVDEVETEVATTGRTGGCFVSLLLDTDCGLRPSALCLGDCEAVLEEIIEGVPIRSAMEAGLVGDDSVGDFCTREVLASEIPGRLVVEPSRRFQREENKPDLFFVSTGAGASSFFSTMRHPTGMSSGTLSDRFLTAVSQSDDDPLLSMKCAIGLSRVIAECLVKRSDFVISFAVADLANGTRGVKVCSGRSVSIRSLLWVSRMRTGALMEEHATYSPSTLSKPRLQL